MLREHFGVGINLVGEKIGDGYLSWQPNWQEGVTREENDTGINDPDLTMWISTAMIVSYYWLQRDQSIVINLGVQNKTGRIDG